MIAYGTLVDAALKETLEVGSGENTRYIRKYTLDEIFKRGLWLEGYGSGDFSLLKRSAAYDEVKA